MTTIRQAYQAFEAQSERQGAILASLRQERTEIGREIAAAQQGLQASLNELFPTLDTLPRDVMAEAARLSGSPAIRDYAQMAQVLRDQDERSIANYNQLVCEHGELATLQADLDALRREGDAVARGITKLKLAVKENETAVDALRTRLAAVQEFNKKYFKKCGLELTSATAKQYGTFKFGRWMTDSIWREGRYALRNYQNKGGQSLQEDTAALETLIAQGQEMRDRLQATYLLSDQMSDRRNGKASVLYGMQNLTKSIVGEQGITAKIQGIAYGDFTDLLGKEEAAKYIGQKLPAAEANRLMVDVVKIDNLRKIDNNLKDMQKQAQKAFDNLAEPLSKLKKAKRDAPSHSIRIDVDGMERQFEPFNKGVKSYLERSKNARRGCANFVPSSNSTVIITTHDDSHFFMNYYLMQMMLSNDAAQQHHHQQAPSFGDGVTVPNFDMPTSGGAPASDGGGFTLPDFGSTPLPDFGSTPLPDFSAPLPDFGTSGGGFAIPDTGSISIPDTGSFGGGGFDSGSFGGSFDSGGGGGFDSSSFIIRNDHPIRADWAPGQTASQLMI